MAISRRQVLAWGSMLASSGLTPALADETLRAKANAAGLHFGSCSDATLGSAPDYAALVLRECDIFAPNLNWKLLAPTSQDVLVQIDPNIAAVTRGGLALTGYHLLWHEGVPPWFAALDRNQAERAVADHIGALGLRFGANTLSWNPVNEAVDPAQGRPDGLRPSPFLDKFGTGYLDLAFNQVRDAAAHVLRVYNDYNLELATPEHAARRAAVLRLLDGLLSRAVPVQAVGLQSHLRTATFGSFDPAVFRGFLRELAARGLRILITELDVLDALTTPILARDQTIADIYRRYLSAALDESAVVSVVTWGLSDRYSWLNDPKRLSFRRADGTPGRPLPFDDQLRPKPAFTALLEAFQAAPRRPLFRPA